MPNKKIALILVATIGAVTTVYYIGLGDTLDSEQPEIEINLLNDPVPGETNTVQATRNGTPLTGETLHINGQPEGELNNAGITEFNTPNQTKITIEIADKTKTINTNQTKSGEEIGAEKHGIYLDSEPEVGETNRITVYDNEERVENEPIYINNERIGETSETGTLTFTPTNTQEITISSESEQLEEITKKLEDYEPETEVEFNINSPEEGDVIDDYETEFEFAVETQEENFDVELQINDETRFEDTATGTSEGYQKEKIIGDANNHQWQVIVEQDGETYESDTITFETTEDIPEPSIELASPTETEQDDFRIDYEASFDSPLGLTYEAYAGDEVVEEGERPDGDDHTVLTGSYGVPLGEGVHDVGMRVTYGQADSYFEKEFDQDIEVTLTEEIPLAVVEIEEGVEGDEESSGEVDYVVEPIKEPVKFEIIVENLDEGEQDVVVESSEEPPLVESLGFDYGFEEDTDYEVYAELEGQETGEEMTSDTVSFSG